MMLASYTRGEKIRMSFVLDDSEAALPMFSDVCAYCKHWIREPGRKCEAFPQGIPLAIWLGENDHHFPYPDDHNIQFAPIAKSAPVQETLPSVVAGKRAAVRQHRFLVKLYRRREAELRARLVQNPQIPKEIVEIIKIEYAIVESKSLKGKSTKKKPVVIK